MIKEIWKPIKGYEGLYEISSLGRIKNLGKEYKITSYGHTRTMYSKPRISKLRQENGYLKVSLTKNSVCKIYSVHRLVAINFIENSDSSKTLINHINGIRSDNRVENLEWCTYSENALHAYRTGLYKRNARSKYVAQLNDDLEIIHVYKTAKTASLAIGVNWKNSNIALACRRKYGKMYGFIWAYIASEQYLFCEAEFQKGKTSVKLEGIEYSPKNNPHIHTSSGGGIPVAQLNDNGNIIAVYRNARQASLALKENDNGRTIRRVCFGDINHHKGYRWKWISKEEYELYNQQNI